MFDILSITGPIYILILLGFIATRVGLFAREDMRILGKFVINFALPVPIFKSLPQRQLGEILNAGYLLAYLAGSLIVFGLGSSLVAARHLATPTAPRAYVITKEMHGDDEFAVAAVSISTLFSGVTYLFWLAVV